MPPKQANPPNPAKQRPAPDAQKEKHAADLKQEWLAKLQVHTQTLQDERDETRQIADRGLPRARGMGEWVALASYNHHNLSQRDILGKLENACDEGKSRIENARSRVIRLVKMDELQERIEKHLILMSTDTSGGTALKATADQILALIERNPFFFHYMEEHLPKSLEKWSRNWSALDQELKRQKTQFSNQVKEAEEKNEMLEDKLKRMTKDLQTCRLECSKKDIELQYLKQSKKSNEDYMQKALEEIKSGDAPSKLISQQNEINELRERVGGLEVEKNKVLSDALELQDELFALQQAVNDPESEVHQDCRRRETPEPSSSTNHPSSQPGTPHLKSATAMRSSPPEDHVQCTRDYNQLRGEKEAVEGELESFYSAMMELRIIQPGQLRKIDESGNYVVRYAERLGMATNYRDYFATHLPTAYNFYDLQTPGAIPSHEDHIRALGKLSRIAVVYVNWWGKYAVQLKRFSDHRVGAEKKVEELQKELDDKNQKYRDYKKNLLAEYKTKLADVKGQNGKDLSAIKEQHTSDLNGLRDTMKAQKDGYENTQNSTNQRIEDLKGEKAKLDEANNKLESVIENLRPIAEKVPSLEFEVETIRGELGTERSSHATTKGLLEDCRKNRTDNEKVTDLETRFEEANKMNKKKQDDLTHKLRNEQASASEAKSLVASVQEKLKVLNEQHDELKTRKTELDTKLGSTVENLETKTTEWDQQKFKLNDQIKEAEGAANGLRTELRKTRQQLEKIQSSCTDLDSQLNMWRKLVLEFMLGHAEIGWSSQLDRLELKTMFEAFNSTQELPIIPAAGSTKWVELLKIESPIAPGCVYQAIKVWYQLVDRGSTTPAYQDLNSLAVIMQTSTNAERWFSLMAIEVGVFHMLQERYPSNWSVEVCRFFLRAVELLCQSYNGMMARLSKLRLKNLILELPLTVGLRNKLNQALWRYVLELLPPYDDTPPSWLSRIIYKLYVNSSISESGLMFIKDGDDLLVLERPEVEELPVKIFSKADHGWVMGDDGWILKVRGLKEPGKVEDILFKTNRNRELRALIGRHFSVSFVGGSSGWVEEEIE